MFLLKCLIGHRGASFFRYGRRYIILALLIYAVLVFRMTRTGLTKESESFFGESGLGRSEPCVLYPNFSRNQSVACLGALETLTSLISSTSAVTAGASSASFSAPQHRYYWRESYNESANPLYCSMFNPDVPTGRGVFCLNDPENYDRVVMVIGEHGRSEMQWLDKLPFRKVVYSKDRGQPSSRLKDPSVDPRFAKDRTFPTVPFNTSFRSPLRSKHFEVPVMFRELPNLGDEALPYIAYCAEFYDELPEVTIFTHDHETAWHMPTSVVELLRCSCMDIEREGYRSLNHGPGFAYFKCIVTETRLRAGVEPLVAQFSLDDLDFLGIQAVANLYEYAFRPFLKSPLKSLIADACGSFIVTRRAIRSRPRELYVALAQLLWNQPHNHTSLLRIEPDMEIAAILERMWRLLFNATDVDNMRDMMPFACAYKDTFVCPKNSFAVRGRGDIVPQYRNKSTCFDISYEWKRGRGMYFL
jgi:hypothetical protein